MAANLTERLAELIDSWQASLDLAVYLADPSRQPSAEIRALGAQLGEKPLHTDWGIALLLGALPATVAMGIRTFFWIVHCVARRGQCRGYCRGRLHLVCDP